MAKQTGKDKDKEPAQDAPSDEWAEIKELLAQSKAITVQVRADMESVKRCLSKMAHMTGNQRVLDEFGIDRWEITQESMRKGGR